LKTFQKPLPKGEEKHYLHLMAVGSTEEKKYAKDKLIEHNLRLVAHVSKKYQNTCEDSEDLISIGCIGLIKAVDSFEESKGALATYACRCIDNELLMYFRSRKKVSREVSLYDPIGKDKEGNEIFLMDALSQNQQEIGKNLEISEDIRRLYDVLDDVLSEREKTIIALRYGLFGKQEMTQSRVAEIFGISRSFVSRLEKRAIRKIQERF